MDSYRGDYRVGHIYPPEGSFQYILMVEATKLLIDHTKGKGTIKRKIIRDVELVIHESMAIKVNSVNENNKRTK